MSMDEQKELVQVAMQIILHAGDARNHATEALKAAKQFDFEKYEYSMLFAHAQDTLMTIMSEINMSTEMIDILKIIKSNM